MLRMLPQLPSPNVPDNLQTLLCRNALEPLVIEEAYIQLRCNAELQIETLDQAVFFQVIAFALNRLPALYATSQSGWERQQKLAQEKLRDRIRATVEMGIIAVRRNPGRDCWLLDLDILTEMPSDQIAKTRPEQLDDSLEAFAYLNRSRLANLSLDELDTLLQQEPDHIEAWLQRGWQQLQAGNYTEALENFDVAAVLDTNNADIWLVRSTVLHKLGQPEQAIASYQQASNVLMSNACR
ncbi:MAG: late competence development ComFB family protein [Cyanobacteria bacterium P01_H01_bin.121]